VPGGAEPTPAPPSRPQRRRADPGAGERIPTQLSTAWRLAGDRQVGVRRAAQLAAFPLAWGSLAAPAMSTIAIRSWQGARAGLGALRETLACWAWAPLLGKTVGWLVLFVGLAYVGSGTVGRLLGTVAARELGPGSGSPAPLGGALGRLEHAAATDGCAGADAGPGEQLACQRADAGARGDGGAPGPPGAKTDDGRVVLNLATEQDLMDLPGIGPKRAQAILALRSKLGRFRRLEELLRVRGLGSRLLERLRPLVVVDRPSA
jgi:competence protein ComEA